MLQPSGAESCELEPQPVMLRVVSCVGWCAEEHTLSSGHARHCSVYVPGGQMHEVGLLEPVSRVVPSAWQGIGACFPPMHQKPLPHAMQPLREAPAKV
jgi:hypothetical protein